MIDELNVHEQAILNIAGDELATLHEAMVEATISNLVSQNVDIDESAVAIVSAFHEKVIDKAIANGAFDITEDTDSIVESYKFVDDSIYIVNESKDLEYVAELPVIESMIEEHEVLLEQNEDESSSEQNTENHLHEANADDIVNNIIASLNL